MKKMTILLLAISLSVSLWGQIPDGYYSTAEGKNKEELKSALNSIIKGHTEFDYGEARYILDETDADPNNQGNIILVYKGISISNVWDQGASWNREHVWAKSHGDFGNSAPAGSDLHNLKPSDSSVNSSRGNKDFAEGGSPHSEATECNVTEHSWEPRDAVKGDIARIMFYMATRYLGENGEPNLSLVDYIPTSSSSNDGYFGKLSDLLKWNEQDPVDDFERKRNEVIYSYQGNRNPFVDRPEYVCKIWGENCGGTSSANEISDLGTKLRLVNPANTHINLFAEQELTAKYFIYNSNGQLVLQGELKGQTSYSIDIDGQDSGIYILKLVQDTAANSYKIIKQ